MGTCSPTDCRPGLSLRAQLRERPLLLPRKSSFLRPNDDWGGVLGIGPSGPTFIYRLRDVDVSCMLDFGKTLWKH